MKKSDFKDKKVTVMGVGLHGGGIATVRFFAEAGAKVIATDMKTEKELASSIEKLKDLKNVKFVLGQHRIEDFENVDLVVKSPAAPWTSKPIQAALKKKIPIEMDSSLFFKLCKLPIVSVTGTKGKTTTSTLIFEILKSAGKKAYSAGIGQKPVLDLLEEIEGVKNGAVVFELSSWRLSALGREGLSPHIAVITNIFPDHLNYYGTMEKYIADKKYIFSSQKPEDYIVLSYDNETTRTLADGAKSKKIFFTTNGKIDSTNDFIGVKAGKIFYRNNGEDKIICDLNDIKLQGGHNIGNILAAVASASAYGIAPEKICEAVKNFKGVPHRLELVREIDGVKYVNDTAATMPEAAIAGINSFSKPVILIAGGMDKNLDFKEFAKAVSEKVKKMILLKGDATEKMKSELKKIGAEKMVDSESDNLKEALLRAKSISDPGDIILFSPGATSFNMFKNEIDRGDKFREAVESI
jgi:UDP-N-acetylmuramoylalanine--D-glutamate ligase